ncbi:MAG: GNAT family N-acyltransferase [Pseudomonadota bacterium]
MTGLQSDAEHLTVRLADSENDVLAAQRLRYAVFVEELGGDGVLVDHQRRLERDSFDPHYDHLVLVDDRRDSVALDHVVGVYRLMTGARARETGRFYSEGEYDLQRLKQSGKSLLELGRSCVHAEYRGGVAMHQLWQGLAQYVVHNQIDLLFGVASFHGTDPTSLAQPLSYLHHNHLAPEPLRVRTLPSVYCSMDLLPKDQIDRRAAMLATPALIKAYLRLGGFVGDGAFIDHDFNTTDVFLLADTARIKPRQRAIYAGSLSDTAP